MQSYLNQFSIINSFPMCVFETQASISGNGLPCSEISSISLPWSQIEARVLMAKAITMSPATVGLLAGLASLCSAIIVTFSP